MTHQAMFRTATVEDLPLVKETLYLALAWDPADPIPPFETVVSHPEIAISHDGWMRPGDAGVVAEVDGGFAGMAYLRLFPEENRGQGFYDADTPELAVGVRHSFRGAGIGTRLMQDLAAHARERGVPRISLSVSKGNPAAALYTRLGYRYVTDEDADLMVIDLS